MFEKQELVSELGSPYTNQVVQWFQKFAFFPSGVLNKLAGQALNEAWGNDNYVLTKYLAVQVPWAIEQRPLHGR